MAIFFIEIIAQLLIFILFQLSSATVTDQVTITNQNIRDFHPALVLIKEGYDDFFYAIPVQVYQQQKGKPPYSVFGGEDYTYLCPLADEEFQEKDQPTNGFNARDYCLVEKKFENSIGPFLCKSQVQPFIIERPQEFCDMLRAKCRNGNKYYTFVYRDCGSHSIIEKTVEKIRKWNKNAIVLASEPIDFENYSFCHDSDKKDTIYTFHIIRAPLLFKDEELNLERSFDFEMKTDDYGLFGDEFQKIKHAYEQGNPYGMVGQKLIPSDDMETGLLRKPTFHYVIVKPMQKKLLKIWNIFNTRLRNLVIRENLQLTRIYTRTIGTLEKDGRLLYLDEDLTVPIPEIWCKVALYETYGIAFIMHNFIDEDEPKKSKYCDIDLCNLPAWSEIENDDSEDTIQLVKKYAYCCRLYSKVANLFPLTEVALNKIGHFKYLAEREFQIQRLRRL